MSKFDYENGLADGKRIGREEVVDFVTSHDFDMLAYWPEWLDQLKDWGIEPKKEEGNERER